MHFYSELIFEKPQGRALPEPQRLSTPTGLKAGRFARTAQTVNLLSQAFRYLNRLRAGVQPGYQHLAQLNRTILALRNLVDEESRQRGIILCCPIGFCSKYAYHPKVACNIDL